MDERIYRCQNGHVIGVVSRGPRGLKRLLLYRQAVDPMDALSVMPDVMAVVESAIEIKCSICETARAWVPGEAELEDIIRRHERHQRGEAAEAIMVKEAAEI